MFVFALKKANICRTLGPKNEHCPSHLTCRPNITNSTLSHNTLHATLRGELASVGVYRSVTGNIISYTQRYGSHPTQRRVLASRNWSQKKAPLSQGLVGGLVGWLAAESFCHNLTVAVVTALTFCNRHCIVPSSPPVRLDFDFTKADHTGL